MGSPGSEGRTVPGLEAELQFQAGTKHTAGAVAGETDGAAAVSAGVPGVLEAQEQPDQVERMLLKGSVQLQPQQTGSAETTAGPELPGSSAVDKHKST